MDKASVVQFLTVLNGKQLQIGADWIGTSCVFAPWKHKGGVDSHPSAAVKINMDGESFYNCFGCGAFDLLDVLHELKRLGAALPLYDLKTAVSLVVSDGTEKNISLHLKENWGSIIKIIPEVSFSEIWLESFPIAVNVARARSYLHGRGLSDEVIVALEIRYDLNIDAVCFPIRNFTGDLRGLRGRRLEPGDFPRYHIYKTGFGQHNPLAWYGEHLLDFDKPIVMVESVFDAAAVYGVYKNVCAPMTALVSKEKADRLKAATELVLFFDADKAGNAGRRKIRNFFQKSYIQDIYPTGGAKDPGEMRRSELIEVLKTVVNLNGKGVFA